MAANLTNYAENAILDGTAMPATLYVKLHIGDPGEDATGSAAATTTRDSFTRSAASGGATSNAVILEWLSVANAETISHISIWDASTAGNPWWYGPLTASKILGVGDDFTIPVGDLDLTLT